MSLEAYLIRVIDQHLGGDLTRFAELWALQPDFGRTLRSFDSDAGWLHWKVKSFDGWYCVAVAGGYEVYYQERGQTHHRRFFEEECDAVRLAFDNALLLPPAT